ncbi:MAG: ATP-binding cassette domain-containing protein [Solirubrobacterales bacterium]
MPEAAVPEEDRVLVYRGGQLTLGRNHGNDVVLDDVNVSRFHAVVVQSGDELEIRDLGSQCGTRLDGRPVSQATLADGSVIGIGPYKLRLDGSNFAFRDERGALRLEATDTTVSRGGKEILRPMSLTVDPGELVAVIGESGSGKTTLLRALAGVSRPDAGTVTLNGDPVTSRLTDVGYVPQDDIVHGLLSVSEALTYAARLRLPDVDSTDIASTVRRVTGELGLEDHRRTRISHLSGGQRKRVGVGSELLNRPSMLFLDEPTTGLDSGLERQLMELFRYLARPASSAVVLVTHATRSLELCDTLVVMGRGGQLRFRGSPADALTFFEVSSPAEIYTALERPAQGPPRAPAPGEAGRGAGATDADVDGAQAPAPGPAGSPRAKGSAAAHTGVLAGRYLKLFVRDRRNALILMGQVPVIALAVAFLFEPGVFDIGPGRTPGDPRDGIQLLFLLVTTAIWFGSIDAAREIVKERAVAAREAAVGVKWGSYLASKAIVLCGVSTVQTLALTYFVLAIHPLDESAGAYLAIAGLLVLCGWAAVGVGLAISAAASSQDQATSVIPLTLIPQLLFAGAIVPVERMTEPIAFVANAFFARWALAGTGAAIDMQERIAPDRSLVAGYGESFFSIEVGVAALVLAAFTAVFFGVARLVVAREREQR